MNLTSVYLTVNRVSDFWSTYRKSKLKENVSPTSSISGRWTSLGLRSTSWYRSSNKFYPHLQQKYWVYWSTRAMSSWINVLNESCIYLSTTTKDDSNKKPSYMMTTNPHPTIPQLSNEASIWAMEVSTRSDVKISSTKEQRQIPLSSSKLLGLC